MVSKHEALVQISNAYNLIGQNNAYDIDVNKPKLLMHLERCEPPSKIPKNYYDVSMYNTNVQTDKHHMESVDVNFGRKQDKWSRYEISNRKSHKQLLNNQKPLYLSPDILDNSTNPMQDEGDKMMVKSDSKLNTIEPI